MRIFSDFRLFEKPPKPSPALFRWIAWRWLLVGFAACCFTLVFFAVHHLGGEPIYYSNEDRDLTSNEAQSVFLLFMSASGAFALLGLVGVIFIPKE